MSYTRGLVTGILGTALVGGAAVGGWWMLTAKSGEAAKSSAPAVPATVPKPFKEEAAATVTLTPEAEAKLALRVADVRRQSMRRTRAYGGEVVIPPGQSVVVAAPLAGVLKPVSGVNLAAGTPVRKGEPVFHLLPLLDPVGRANLIASKVDAEGQVQNASEQFKAANIALSRARNVLSGGAGSQRQVDEAQALVDVAKRTLEAATARRELLDKVVGEVSSGTAAAIPVEAPADGIVRTVSALSGQTVPAGAALFEVVNLDTVWVRIGVYAGDLTEIDPGMATLTTLTAHPGTPSRPAMPVAAPPTIVPQPGTADLFYAVPNPPAALAAVTGFAAVPCDGPRLSPGQRVAVAIPLNDPAQSLTVPWAAIVYDYHGGTWVYQKVGERTYSRQRVIVRYVKDDTAVLDAGPSPGAMVVTTGAAELFGTEAGFSK